MMKFLQSRMKLLAGGARTLLALVWLIAVPAVSHGQQALTRIRIGSTTPSITTLPIEIAARRGFFRDERLEAEMISIRSADIIMKALLAGQLDYSTSLASLASVAVKGLPI